MRWENDNCAQIIPDDNSERMLFNSQTTQEIKFLGYNKTNRYINWNEIFILRPVKAYWQKSVSFIASIRL